MKTINIFTILCFFSILTTAMTCGDDFDESCDIIIANKSGDNIYIQSFVFDDTTTLTPMHVFERFEPGYPYKIENNGVFHDHPVIDALRQSGMKYQLIIFKQSTMDKHSKEELVEKNIFDKRYILTWKDLQSMRFNITYTGKR